MSFDRPPMRPEVVEAVGRMDTEGEKYAFAAIPHGDGIGWALFTRQNRVHTFISQRFATEEEASEAGLQWLATRPPEAI